MSRSLTKQELRTLGVSRIESGRELGLTRQLAETMSVREILGIDLDAVISKYADETEKHLERLFKLAADAGAVLLLDEADALFEKRSEVRDSHDRYANIEIAYLVQQIESLGGIAILTTTRKANIDAAFLRRLRVIVHFPSTHR